MSEQAKVHGLQVMSERVYMQAPVPSGFLGRRQQGMRTAMLPPTQVGAILQNQTQKVFTSTISASGALPCPLCNIRLGDTIFWPCGHHFCCHPECPSGHTRMCLLQMCGMAVHSMTKLSAIQQGNEPSEKEWEGDETEKEENKRSKDQGEKEDESSLGSERASALSQSMSLVSASDTDWLREKEKVLEAADEDHREFLQERFHRQQVTW